MEELIDSMASGKSSEHLPMYNSNVDIISAQLADPNNRWANYLCVQKMDVRAFLPFRATPGSAGYDLQAFESIIIPAWGSAKFDLKIKLVLPIGTMGRIASRSGLALKHGLEVGAGVIDSDYRGEIGVIIRNHSDFPYSVNRGDKIAQLIIHPILTPEVKEVKSMEDIFGTTERGSGGFGSTDIKK